VTLVPRTGPQPPGRLLPVFDRHGRVWFDLRR
jgi:hypothetical protein